MKHVDDLVAATAPLQTCAGLPGGIEASIHAMMRIFNDEETDAILLVDARNAFNAMNRQAALHNIIPARNYPHSFVTFMVAKLSYSSQILMRRFCRKKGQHKEDPNRWLSTRKA